MPPPPQSSLVRAFRVAYDGRPYHGYQRQPDVPTVADALLDALVSLDVLDRSTTSNATADSEDETSPRPDDDRARPDDDGARSDDDGARPDDSRTRPTPPGYAAAGRTDAGVSALAQTVAFSAPAWLTPRALNSRLPDTVSAWASADVADDFHATHDATRRTYCYHLFLSDGDRARAKAATEALSGTHDFHNLTPDESGTERTLSCELLTEPLGNEAARTGGGDALTLRVAADGFPRQLVRRLVTVVRSVATGAASLDRIDRLLAPEPVDGPAGVQPAPPEPLVLADVHYPEVTFEPDREAVERTRAVFRRQRRRGVVTARVAETVLDGVPETDERRE